MRWTVAPAAFVGSWGGETEKLEKRRSSVSGSDFDRRWRRIYRVTEGDVNIKNVALCRGFATVQKLLLGWAVTPARNVGSGRREQIEKCTTFTRF
jgi:hypothetical protein